MNPIKTGSLAVFLLAALPVGPCFGAAESPDGLELNGITSCLGIRRAFFQTGDGRNLMLAEGESNSGIKLVAIDAPANLVRIEIAGRARSLRICPTPSLTANQTGDSLNGTNQGEAMPVSGGGLLAIPNADGTLTKFDPAVAAFYGAAGGSKTPDGGNGGSAATANGQSQADWYQRSAMIERQRQLTAQEVAAGTMLPWPRTPLTPHGIPAQLVSDEVMYANHIPGFMQSGSLPPL